MKTLNLTIGDRLMLNRLINDTGKGVTYNDLRIIMKILNRVSIEEEEKKRVKFTEKNGQIKWENAKYIKEIEFSDDEIKYMKTRIEEYDKEKKFFVVDGVNMISLISKIKDDEE